MPFLAPGLVLKSYSKNVYLDHLWKTERRLAEILKQKQMCTKFSKVAVLEKK